MNTIEALAQTIADQRQVITQLEEEIDILREWRDNNIKFIERQNTELNAKRDEVKLLQQQLANRNSEINEMTELQVSYREEIKHLREELDYYHPQEEPVEEG